MATSSYKTFLMYKKADAYEKLVDIKDYGDIGGDPEQIETTTLSDRMQTFIEGIMSQEALPFTINYDLVTYQKILDMKGVETDFSIWFGGDEVGNTVTPTGVDGKFNFKGTASIKVNGKGVNEVREATVTLTPSTPITLGE